MSGKIFWNLLVIFGVLYQSIGTFAENYTDESSELLIRQKRVINRTPGGDKKEFIVDFPYVVSVKQLRGPNSCVGVILTENIILTLAKCVEVELSRYKVHSGSARILSGSHPIIHSVVNKRILIGTHPHRPADGIALLTIFPPLNFSASAQPIQIYEGYIYSGAVGTVSGWGCHYQGHPGTEFSNHLRSITVPIISYQECAILYNNILSITERDICTFDTTGFKYCGATDSGAPLVIKEGGRHHLVGLHIWNGKVAGRNLNADVFVDLRNSKYKNWIRETVSSLEAYNRRNQGNLRHIHEIYDRINID